MPTRKSSKSSKSSPFHAEQPSWMKLGSNKWGNMMLNEDEKMTSAEKRKRAAWVAPFNAALAAHKASPKRLVHKVKNTVKAKPRKGKVMRECKCNAKGCNRHKTTKNCKFVHRNEPEYEMLRPNQKAGGGANFW